MRQPRALLLVSGVAFGRTDMGCHDICIYIIDTPCDISMLLSWLAESGYERLKRTDTRKSFLVASNFQSGVSVFSLASSMKRLAS